MKYLILILLTTTCLNAQTVTHHEDKRGRRWQIHTFEKPGRDSVIAYVYGKPQRSDRPIITLTRRGEAYDLLLFIKARRRGPKYWSFLPN